MVSEIYCIIDTERFSHLAMVYTFNEMQFSYMVFEDLTILNKNLHSVLTQIIVGNDCIQNKVDTQQTKQQILGLNAIDSR